MVQDKDSTYLHHILDEISNIEIFLSNTNEQTFINSDNDEPRYAVVRSLEIIGEAAARVSKNLKDASPKIKWSSMVGMRNKIVHEYLEVDYQVVWETVKNDLPPLKIQIGKILSSLE